MGLDPPFPGWVHPRYLHAAGDDLDSAAANASNNRASGPHVSYRCGLSRRAPCQFLARRRGKSDCRDIGYQRVALGVQQRFRVPCGSLLIVTRRIDG